jgi:hypothetical protein
MSENRYIEYDNGVFDNVEKHFVSFSDLVKMLNAYDEILKQTELIREKMKDSWLLKKLVKK